MCLPRSTESLSRRRDGEPCGCSATFRVVCRCKYALVTVFPPLVAFHRRPPVLGSRRANARVFGHARVAVARVHAYVYACVRSEQKSGPAGEKGTRAGVEVYRGSPRIESRFSIVALGTASSSLFERTIFFSLW